MMPAPAQVAATFSTPIVPPSRAFTRFDPHSCLKMGPRPGDAAPMALMQLVEGEAPAPAPAGDAPAKGRKKKEAAPKKDKAPAKKAAKAGKAEAAPKRRKKAAA
jgi:hypothetical protein